VHDGQQPNEYGPDALIARIRKPPSQLAGRLFPVLRPSGTRPRTRPGARPCRRGVESESWWKCLTDPTTVVRDGQQPNGAGYCPYCANRKVHGPTPRCSVPALPPSGTRLEQGVDPRAARMDAQKVWWMPGWPRPRVARCIEQPNGRERLSLLLVKRFRHELAGRPIPDIAAEWHPTNGI
jgi:hypothetical protein